MALNIDLRSITEQVHCAVTGGRCDGECQRMYLEGCSQAYRVMADERKKSHKRNRKLRDLIVGYHFLYGPGGKPQKPPREQRGRR